VEKPRRSGLCSSAERTIRTSPSDSVQFSERSTAYQRVTGVNWRIRRRMVRTTDTPLKAFAASIEEDYSD